MVFHHTNAAIAFVMLKARRRSPHFRRQIRSASSTQRSSKIIWRAPWPRATDQAPVLAELLERFPNLHTVHLVEVP